MEERNILQELFCDISLPPSEQTRLQLCGFAGQFVFGKDGGMIVVTHRTIRWYIRCARCGCFPCSAHHNLAIIHPSLLEAAQTMAGGITASSQAPPWVGGTSPGVSSRNWADLRRNVPMSLLSLCHVWYKRSSPVTCS